MQCFISLCVVKKNLPGSMLIRLVELLWLLQSVSTGEQAQQQQRKVKVMLQAINSSPLESYEYDTCVKNTIL